MIWALLGRINLYSNLMFKFRRLPAQRLKSLGRFDRETSEPLSNSAVNALLRAARSGRGGKGNHPVRMITGIVISPISKSLGQFAQLVDRHRFRGRISNLPYRNSRDHHAFLLIDRNFLRPQIRYARDAPLSDRHYR